MSGRRLFALVGVSFLAVYRVAFETVLFYQALWLQSQDTQPLIIWGFIGGKILVAALVWGIFKFAQSILLLAPVVALFWLRRGIQTAETYDKA